MWSKKIGQQGIKEGDMQRFLVLLCLVLLIVSQSAISAQAQICKPESIPAATPSSDFVDKNDGTVLHKPTGLIWMRCALGQQWDGKTCNGVPPQRDWQQALQSAATFNENGGFAGHKDWRLPSIKELDSIVETQCFQPAINLEIFPATPPRRFWSSSMDIRHPKSYAWYIEFETGYLDEGRGVMLHYMRLVRSGQPPADFDRKMK